MQQLPLMLQVAAVEVAVQPVHLQLLRLPVVQEKAEFMAGAEPGQEVVVIRAVELAALEQSELFGPEQPVHSHQLALAHLNFQGRNK